jgi:hypothetical protein
MFRREPSKKGDKQQMRLLFIIVIVCFFCFLVFVSLGIPLLPHFQFFSNMPPKIDPNQVTESMFCSILHSIPTHIQKTHFFFFSVVVRVVGGEGANPSSLAPKLGPLGLVLPNAHFK